MATVAVLRAADGPQHPYAWVITRDRDHELHGRGKSAVGVAGPSGASVDMIARAHTHGRRFRLCDEGDVDDLAARDATTADPTERGVVYEGLVWTQDIPGSETDFGPLRDYGGPNYGCTEIQYLKDGRWLRL